MSGPKSYSPTVYNINIQKALNLQSSIQSIYDRIRDLDLNDKDRAICFNCRHFIESNSARLKLATNLLPVKSFSTTNQSEYNKYQNLLSEIESELKKLLSEIEAEEKKFINRENDYHAFVSYENFFRQTVSDFNCFKSQVIEYLVSYLEKEYPHFSEKAKKDIESIQLHARQSDFCYDFRNKKDNKKKEIINETQDCESTINYIRAKISDLVMQELKKNPQKMSFSKKTLESNDKKFSDSIERLKAKIENYIQNVDNVLNKKNYKNQLDHLIKSPTFSKNEYYYTELFEEIRRSEKISNWKYELQQSTVELNKMQIHDNCKDEYKYLIGNALSLIEKDIIKHYEIDNYRTRYKIFIEENQQQIRDEIFKAKERQFIKAQLIESLEKLDYKVMNDMKVVDFESESDFLFIIPHQSNYLNLRFNPDGTLLYNFLIPEKKTNLSIDLKKQRLREMESTCNNFKSLLVQLSDMGLNIELNKEAPVCENALIQVPKKHRNILPEKETINSKMEKKNLKRMTSK
jgi:hypothetical protein